MRFLKRLWRTLTTDENTEIALLQKELAAERISGSYDKAHFKHMCEGEDAHERGLPRDANPYANEEWKNTLPDEAWDTGWCAADYDRLADEVEQLRTELRGWEEAYRGRD